MNSAGYDSEKANSIRIARNHEVITYFSPNINGCSIAVDTSTQVSGREKTVVGFKARGLVRYSTSSGSNWLRRILAL